MDTAGDHAERNRSVFNRQAGNYVEPAERNWAAAEESWGRWGVPEAQLHVLPERLEGLDCIELGCGTAYVSAWLARRGGRPVGIDVSEEQLATASRMQGEHGLSFPLLHGDAEQVPLPDASFDLAISEYGACLFCDPHRWIPEASRLLRPGGQLIFLTNSVIAMLCEPDDVTVQPTNEMLRPYFGMRRFEWPEDESVEFHLPHGELIALLRANDLAVEELIEVCPPQGSSSRYPTPTLEWARQWPCEEIWKARKAG